MKYGICLRCELLLRHGSCRKGRSERLRRFYGDGCDAALEAINDLQFSNIAITKLGLVEDNCNSKDCDLADLHLDTAF